MVIFYHPKINFLLTYRREKFTFPTKNNVKNGKYRAKETTYRAEVIFSPCKFIPD